MIGAGRSHWFNLKYDRHIQDFDIPMAANNTSLRQQIEEYLNTLTQGIDGQIIQTEADIEQMFRVETDQQLALWKLKGVEGRSQTLLEILGFGSSEVDDHPVRRAVIGQIMYAPDYLLKCPEKILAVVDLKAPGQNWDHDRWIGQIVSYCRELKVPIGLLFNGTDVRVFINVELN